MRKILVLGGTGFIGSRLIEKLHLHGEEVYGFSRKPPPDTLHSKSAGWYTGDFLDIDMLSEAVSGCTHVYHLISTTLPHESNKDPVADVRYNLIGTLNLLNLIKSENTCKIIFSSSGGTIYGPQNSLLINESSPTNPICSYGIVKLAIEKYLHMYHSLFGMDYVSLRLANIYGEHYPTGRSQGAINTFINNAINNRPIEVWGNGKVVRDYIYIEDAITALYESLSEKANNHVINIGSGRGLSLNEVISIISRNIPGDLEVTYKKDRACDVPSNILNISLAKTLLDWSPLIEPEEGIKRIIQSMKTN